jgi:hypothetical protein
MLEACRAYDLNSKMVDSELTRLDNRSAFNISCTNHRENGPFESQLFRLSMTENSTEARQNWPRRST